MPIHTCPGEFVAHVYFRTCHRSVQIDPARLPPAPITERLSAALPLHELRRTGRGHSDRLDDSPAAAGRGHLKT